jgi:NAD(P)-dependent dehydrogenase (short-subunit alcohol dehydrogenase family)
MTGVDRSQGRFRGKVMVVTGAAQGIGRTVALGAAREGASVVLVDRAEIVHDVRAELEGVGAQALAVTTDLENYSGADSAMAQALDRFGRIDSWSTMSAARSGPSPMASTVRPKLRRKSGARCSRRCGAAGQCFPPC